jgi:hypothetical protein
MKALKAKFEGVRSVGKPRKDGKMRCNRMLLAFCAVATGSWPLMIEHCAGQGPIWAVAPLDGWMIVWSGLLYTSLGVHRRISSRCGMVTGWGAEKLRE